MSLSKPSQQLRLNLREAAALLKWSGTDHFSASETPLMEENVADAHEIKLHTTQTLFLRKTGNIVLKPLCTLGTPSARSVLGRLSVMAIIL